MSRSASRLGLLRLRHSCRQWREKQAEEIKARDEASKAKREETVAKAERAIDQFYEEYSKKKERNIRENKFVPPLLHAFFLFFLIS